MNTLQSPRWASLSALLAIPSISMAITGADMPVTYNQAGSRITANSRLYTANNPASKQALFQWGEITIHPNASYTCAYGDAFSIAPGETVNSYIHSVRLGAELELGPHWAVDYTSDWKRYSDRHLTDRTDQDFRISAAYKPQTWSILFNQNYLSTSDVNLETARQNFEKDWITNINITKLLGNRWSSDVDLSQNLRFPEAYPISRDWRGGAWLNVHLSQTFNTGIGITAGYMDIDPGVNSTSYGEALRARWQPLRKIALTASVGREHRNFDQDSYGSVTSTAYLGSVVYEASTNTQISIATSQAISPSLLRNQLAKQRDITIEGRQRLFDHLSTRVSYSKEFINYILPTTGTGRSDTSDLWHAGIEAPIFLYGKIELFYTHTRNKSSNRVYELHSNQIGATLHIRL